MNKRRKFLQQLGGATLAGFTLPSCLLGQKNVEIATTHKNITPKKRMLRVAHITDCHVISSEACKSGMKELFRQLNTMADKPDMILNTGDLVMDANNKDAAYVQSCWDTWNEVSKDNKIPMQFCLGNHDVWYGDKAIKDDPRYEYNWFLKETGIKNPYYSVEKGGWKFIMLNSPDGKTDWYRFKDEQWNWLQKELENTPPHIHICISSHVPIISMASLIYYVDRDNEKVALPSDSHKDMGKLKNLFYKHKNIKICLSGHIHYIDRVDYLGISYLCNGAASANWWDGELNEFPNVYYILDLFSDGSFEGEIVYYLKKAKV